MYTYLKISLPKTNKTMSIIRHIFVNAVRYILESGCENTNGIAKANKIQS